MEEHGTVVVHSVSVHGWMLIHQDYKKDCETLQLNQDKDHSQIFGASLANKVLVVTMFLSVMDRADTEVL